MLHPPVSPTLHGSTIFQHLLGRLAYDPRLWTHCRPLSLTPQLAISWYGHDIIMHMLMVGHAWGEDHYVFPRPHISIFLDLWLETSQSFYGIVVTTSPHPFNYGHDAWTYCNNSLLIKKHLTLSWSLIEHWHMFITFPIFWDLTFTCSPLLFTIV